MKKKNEHPPTRAEKSQPNKKKYNPSQTFHTNNSPKNLLNID